jgi:hypothetical protein
MNLRRVPFHCSRFHCYDFITFERAFRLLQLHFERAACVKHNGETHEKRDDDDDDDDDDSYDNKVQNVRII